MKTSRYHPLLVLLHWLLGIMITVALVLGALGLQALPNDSPDKIFALRGHMMAGGLILILTLVRIMVRLRTQHPVQLDTGSAFLNKIAVFAHYGHYLLTLLMAASGIGLSIQTDLPAAVFSGTAILPESFADYPPRVAHGAIAKLLTVLIALHVTAALYHHLIRKDGLLERMWFGHR
jgi:cytochrome b561